MPSNESIASTDKTRACRLQQVTEHLDGILASMQSLVDFNPGDLESLTRRMEAISSELDLDRLFDALSRILQDSTFSSVREWKRQHPRSRALAYFPVYAPVEIIHAAGMLPVGLARTPSSLQCSDSHGESPACSIVKITLGMAMKFHPEPFDGFLFSSLCASAENLYSVFKRTLPGAYVTCIHLPQSCDSSAEIDSLSAEYHHFMLELERQSGKQISNADLCKSMDLYNLQRSLLENLYAVRSELPHLLTGWECYLVSSVGDILPVEEHIPILQRTLSEIRQRARSPRQSLRVILEGFSCEQPSAEIVRLLEAAGCAVVEDDFAIAQRCLQREILTNGDPVRALAERYLQNAALGSRRGSSDPRWETLVEKVHRAQADAVVMLIPNSCPAGFLDYVLFRRRLGELGIPLLSLSRTPSGGISLVKESDLMGLMEDFTNNKHRCVPSAKSA